MTTTTTPSTPPQMAIVGRPGFGCTFDEAAKTQSDPTGGPS